MLDQGCHLGLWPPDVETGGHVVSIGGDCCMKGALVNIVQQVAGGPRGDCDGEPGSARESERKPALMVHPADFDGRRFRIDAVSDAFVVSRYGCVALIGLG